MNLKLGTLELEWVQQLIKDGGIVEKFEKRIWL